MTIQVEGRFGRSILVIGGPSPADAIFENHDVLRARCIDDGVSLLEKERTDFILCDVPAAVQFPASDLLNLAFGKGALVCFSLADLSGTVALKALDLPDLAETLSDIPAKKPGSDVFQSLRFSAFSRVPPEHRWGEALSLVSELEASPKPLTIALRRISSEGLKAEIKNGLILVSKAQR